MIVRVKLPVHELWSAEEDSIGFLSVGVDISESIIFQKMTNFLAHGDNE